MMYEPIAPINPTLPAPMAGLSSAGADAAVTQANTGVGGLSPATQGLIDNNINPINGNVLKPGFFGEGGMAQIGIGAIGTLGSLWNSFQQSKIAKKSLALQEKTFETNLANQTQSYNTELEDRIRTRYAAEGRENADAQADSYIEKNKL